jgi:hypothetical protein
MDSTDSGYGQTASFATAIPKNHGTKSVVNQHFREKPGEVGEEDMTPRARG